MINITYQYHIRMRESKVSIAGAHSLEEAKQVISAMEKCDEIDDFYIPNSYEIYNIETQEIL